jgi:beta-xylosidase
MCLGRCDGRRLLKHRADTRADATLWGAEFFITENGCASDDVVADDGRIYDTDRVEIVQLCAADTATGVTLPAQQLIGFARVDLDPGASRTLSFVVPMSVLAYTGLSDELVMEPGPVEVSAGSSSSDIGSSATFTVTGQMRVIKGEDRAFFSVATVDS